MDGELYKGVVKIVSLFIIFFQYPIMPYRELHPFFISVTEIKQNPKEKTLEVSCKIFTDDFEETLRQNYKTPIDLVNPINRKKMENLISEYVQKHLKIIVNDKLTVLQFIGYEKDKEAIWTYCQVNNVDAVRNIEVMNNLLYEYKKEQINLLHVTINGKRKSTQLTNPEAKVSFEF